MQTIFGLCSLLLSANAYIDSFVKISLKKGEKIVGNEVDLTGAIRVDSEFDCVNLCRQTSMRISPDRVYDHACDTQQIYEHGRCYINEIPSLSDFVYDKAGHAYLHCSLLCSLMSDCHMCQTETKYTSRSVYKTCSFINNNIRIEKTRLHIDIQMKKQTFNIYQSVKTRRS